MKTPIEKAADYLIDQFSDKPLGNEDPEHVADCIRRALEREVPAKKSPKPLGDPHAIEMLRYNQCRHDVGFGLEDSNDR